MAESALPQKPETTQRLRNEGEKSDTARSLLPPGTPSIPLRRPPPPSPISSGLRAEPPMTPKKETARLTILPKPSPSPTLVQLAPGFVATSKPIGAFDSIPRWFCWGLLGLSALIFLIQIWNYAVS